MKKPNVRDVGATSPRLLRWSRGRYVSRGQRGRIGNSRSRGILAAALCLLGAALSGRAQNISIDWFTLDGGGGASTGGGFAVVGTIGQPDASAQLPTGGNFSVTGGFWSLFAVQTPGAPRLAIRLASTNTVLVSWPSPSVGFVLQQNTDLNTANWATAPEAVSDTGTSRFILASPPAGKRFYRLFKP